MIKIWNGLTRRKEVLKTAVPGVLNWYACGPTVYDDAHLGHARTFITQDIVRRIMERYGKLKVNLQLGITDIDDKIIKKATAEEVDYKAISKKYELSFVKTMRQLNVKSPWKYSRVSDNIEFIIQFVQTLLDKGFAYRGVSGSIYFSILEFQTRGFVYPKFRCSKNDIIHEESEKRCSADFALWKAAKPGEPSWAAFDGHGRPGWHIECSTMVHQGLGVLDLHSGGIDLRFPHHENEVAQSEAFTGASPWCPQFIHFGHVQYGGEKMSKSLRNYITIDDFLVSHDSDALRMMCLMKPYAEDFEVSDSLVASAERNVSVIKAFIANCNLWIAHNIASIANEFTEADIQLKSELELMFKDVEDCSIDNFDTTTALKTIMAAIEILERSKQTHALHPLLYEQAALFVGEFFDSLGFRLQDQSIQSSNEYINELVLFRENVRRLALGKAPSDVMLRLCDQIRANLCNHKIIVNDNPGGSIWKYK